MVVPTLLNRYESWTLQRRQVSKLHAFEMACLSRVEGVTRIDRVRNMVVQEALRQKAVSEIVKEKQRNCKAKLEQMCELPPAKGTTPM